METILEHIQPLKRQPDLTLSRYEPETKQELNDQLLLTEAELIEILSDRALYINFNYQTL